jgi:dynein heavy chain 1, cytosolic
MESLVASPTGLTSNGVTSSSYPTIEPILVVEHLAAVLETTLGATRKELEHIGSLLSKARYSDTIQRCTRFATAESQATLHVRKDIIAEGQDDLHSSTDAFRKAQIVFVM